MDASEELAYMCYRSRDPGEGLCRTGPFPFTAAFKWVLQFHGSPNPVYVETVIATKDKKEVTDATPR
ncbi:hypothetical protein LCGC14_2392590 [marine sediment metagenome]|uniref:Uncharacterized protein n=1 Tax=marine sediment metagenome TaxID=412755 RepID=A0A0F9EA45_9ZZZZ